MASKQADGDIEDLSAHSGEVESDLDSGSESESEDESGWPTDEDERLLNAVYSNQPADSSSVRHIDWGEVVKSLTGRSEGDCRQRLQVLHASKGGYFAMVEEFWPKCDDGSDITTVTIDPSSWDALRATVCRTQPPNFKRIKLDGDRCDQEEFVAVADAANLANIAVRPADELMTTMNDKLIPVDLFRFNRTAADKAHLLKGACGCGDLAISWLCSTWLGHIACDDRNRNSPEGCFGLCR